MAPVGTRDFFSFRLWGQCIQDLAQLRPNCAQLRPNCGLRCLDTAIM